MRPATLAEAVERVRAGVSADVAFAEFVDTFDLTDDDGARLAALNHDPGRCGDAKLDALVGAIGEYLAKQYGLERIPGWTGAPWRRLDEPWFTTSSSSPEMKEYLAYASPSEFRSRNIFTDEHPLRRARNPLFRRAPVAPA